MSKLQNIRIIEIPKFRAVSSGLKTFDELFSENGFGNWIELNGKIIKNIIYAAPDFMWHEGEKNVWIYAVEDWVTEKDAAPYEIIEFEGGIYAAVTADENDNDDCGEVYYGALKWIENNGVFESDDKPGNRCIFHRVGCGAIQEALGMAQQEMFLPIKLRNE